MEELPDRLAARDLIEQHGLERLHLLNVNKSNQGKIN